MIARASIVAAKLLIGGACIGYGTLSAARRAPASMRHAAQQFRDHRFVGDRKDGSRPPLTGIALAAASAVRSATEPMREDFDIVKIGSFIIATAAR
jgi:hypothetical protein